MPGPHACGACDRTYTTPGALKNHVACDHGDRRHTCAFCGRTCKDASDNRRHQRTCKRRHGDVLLTQHVCPWWTCSYKGPRRDNAKRHVGACALRPANWSGELPGPIKVPASEQAGGAMPDVSLRKANAPKPEPEVQAPEQETQEEQIALPKSTSGVRDPPLDNSGSEPMAPPMLSEGRTPMEDVMGSYAQWTPSEDGVTQEYVEGDSDFDQGAALNVAAMTPVLYAEWTEVNDAGVADLSDEDIGRLLSSVTYPEYLSGTA